MQNPPKPCGQSTPALPRNLTQSESCTRWCVVAFAQVPQQYARIPHPGPQSLLQVWLRGVPADSAIPTVVRIRAWLPVPSDIAGPSYGQIQSSHSSLGCSILAASALLSRSRPSPLTGQGTSSLRESRPRSKLGPGREDFFNGTMVFFLHRR